ncbi:MAG: response regulator [Acetobacteraceae bacterium]
MASATGSRPFTIAELFLGFRSFRLERPAGAGGSIHRGSDDMNDEMAAKMTDRNESAPPVGMVVDDDALVRESVAEVLEDLCGHVYRAADGLEGLEMLRQHPDISVIVTDIAMPRLDGITFADRARRIHPALKVLFVSGMQRPPASEEFLAKPFPTRALVSALHHLLEAR